MTTKPGLTSMISFTTSRSNRLPVGLLDRRERRPPPVLGDRVQGYVVTQPEVGAERHRYITDTRGE